MTIHERTNPKKKRNWEKDVLPHVKEELNIFYREGIVPTLRTIFYRLASRNIIRNTQYDYTYLSEYTARCRSRWITLKRLLPHVQKIKRDGLGEWLRDILYSQQLLKIYVKQRYEINNNDIIFHDEHNKNKKYILTTNEVLPIGCFSDETRGVSENFNDVYETPEEHIKANLDNLEGLPNGYKKLIPKWYNQPYYVEIWTEKNAMLGTLESIVKDLDVRIVYNRGFDSWSHTWQTYQRIKKMLNEGKKVKILYFGDLDPSGDIMDETINEKMNICFDVEEHISQGQYEFRRIGVLYEHVKKFNLLSNQDPEVLLKLKEDRRKKRFMQKYGLQSEDELFQVEIDALAASAPLDFKNMVIDEISKYYNDEIYENLLSDPRHSNEQISLHVRKNVQNFLDKHSK